MKATVGRIVLWRQFDTPLPAMVIGIGQGDEKEERLSIVVFGAYGDSAQTFHYVPKGIENYQWSWPERNEE